MLDIKITDNTRIISDDKNYIVQKRNKLSTDFGGKKAGEWGGWRDEGYYQEWDHLMEDMIHLKIRHSDAKTLKQVVDVVNKIKMPKRQALEA